MNDQCLQPYRALRYDELNDLWTLTAHGFADMVPGECVIEETMHIEAGITRVELKFVNDQGGTSVFAGVLEQSTDN